MRLKRTVLGLLVGIAGLGGASPVAAQQPVADLSVTKTGPANSAPGSDVVYTITVTNNGPDDAANAILSDSLPAGVTFVDAEQTSGPEPTEVDLISDPATVTWSTLGNGATATFTVTVNVDADFAGDLLNTAVVTSDTSDPNPANNTSTAALAVTTTTTTTTTTVAPTTTTTIVPTTTTVAATTTLGSTTSTTPVTGLPATGTSSSSLGTIALVALVAGVGLIVIATRNRRTHEGA